MTEAIRCMGCSGPIEDLSSPDIVRATKSVKPPTLTGRLKADDDVAYFHSGCFRTQGGYMPA
ncbi:MAG TPA: hypothetical protein VHI31_01835 [Actinomycetota bacterium]|nr:hypothetical protein [Actinomycetota bacterium]